MKLERICSPRARRLAVMVRALFSALAVLALSSSAAHASPGEVDNIRKLSEKAMEAFDLLDYEDAKKLLSAAVARAESAGLDAHPEVARVHLNIGIVYFSGEDDVDRARAAFTAALRIDAGIEIAPVYRTGDMQALLDEIRQELGGDAVSCAQVQGLVHTLIDTAPTGKDVAVEVFLGRDVQASRVVLHHRLHGPGGGGEDFAEIRLTSDGTCKYTGVLPGSLVSAGVIHYYVAAYDDDDRVLASKGSYRAPNLIEIAAGGDGSDGDNPLISRRGDEDARSGKAPRVFLSVALGSGGGYITGETEQVRAPINCCFAPALFHVFPEVGYFIEEKTSLSLAFRLGFPIGANRPNRAGPAPAALLRLRRSLASDGEGAFWSAALGGGVIRQTVQLAGIAEPDMDVDTSAIGPLFVGAGGGFSYRMSDAIRAVAEVNVTTGVPVVSELASARLNFGVQLDVNIGMMFAF